MAISLSKGANVSLSKEDPSLEQTTVGLGWDPKATDGQDFDLDASAFMLDASGKALSEKHFIFYGAMKSPEGSVEHTGDNRTGKGEGDDEQIKVDLGLVPAQVAKIAFSVTIHDADKRKQNFGQVGGAFIRIVNTKTEREIARFDLAEDYSTQTALIFGEIYRNGAEWKFRAVGEGYAGGLSAMAKQYGIDAS